MCRHCLWAGTGQLRRTADRRVSRCLRRSPYLPGRQRLLVYRMGTALAGSLRDLSSCHSPEEHSPGVAEASVSLGRWQAADYRGGDLATQGHLWARASPREDPGRAADPSGGQGYRLYLWAASQRNARPTAAPPRLFVSLSNCTSTVLGPTSITVPFPQPPGLVSRPRQPARSNSFRECYRTRLKKPLTETGLQQNHELTRGGC